MLKKLFHKVCKNHQLIPLPSYEYSFVPMDYDNWVGCFIIARCLYTREVYKEQLILTIPRKNLLSDKVLLNMTKDYLRHMMNHRLGIEVPA